MNLLANENVPGEVVEHLRGAGHDVAWVRLDGPGSSDDEVLARSTSGDRVLLTFDKDFGELVFARGARASAGVILIRVMNSSPTALAEFAVKVLATRTDWPGHFSVIEGDRIRMRRLPT